MHAKESWLACMQSPEGALKTPQCVSVERHRRALHVYALTPKQQHRPLRGQMSIAPRGLTRIWALIVAICTMTTARCPQPRYPDYCCLEVSLTARCTVLLAFAVVCGPCASNGGVHTGIQLFRAVLGVEWSCLSH